MRFLSVFSGVRHSIRPLHVNLQTTCLKPYSGFLPCLISLFYRYLCRYQPLFLHFLSCFDVLLCILLFGDAMNRVSTIFSVHIWRRAMARLYDHFYSQTRHGASLLSFFSVFCPYYIYIIYWFIFYWFLNCYAIFIGFFRCKTFH